MNEKQEAVLRELCDNFHVPFDAGNYRHPFDLPAGWVAGMVGPIYVGCDLEGRISS